MFLCLERLLFKISASQIYIQLLLHFPRLLLSRRGPPFRARRFSSRETPPPPSRPLPSLPLSPSASLPLSLPASRCAGPAPPPPLPRAKRWLGDDAPGQRRRRPRPRPVPVPGHGAARPAPPVAVGLPTPAAASSVCSACAHMLQVLQETLPAFATRNPSCWFRSGQLSLIHSRLVRLRLF